jgi:hypothetical protein
MPYVINFELTQYKIVLPLGVDQRLFDINISGSLKWLLRLRELPTSDWGGDRPEGAQSGHLRSWHQRRLSADTVEKLDKNRGLLFCKKPNHHELLVAASM